MTKPTEENLTSLQYEGMLSDLVRDHGADALSADQKTAISQALHMVDPAEMTTVGKIEWTATIETRVANGWSLLQVGDHPINFGGPGVCMS